MRILEILERPGIYNEVHDGKVSATYLVTKNKRLISVSTGEEVTKADIETISTEIEVIDGFTYEQIYAI